MTFEEKVIAMYEYIVGDVSTTGMPLCLRNKYGITVTKNECTAILNEFGLNYLDHGNQAKVNLDGGQHKGSYEDGFTANDGQVYEITPDIIRDYMNTYKRKKYNLEEYLDRRFNGGGVGFDFDFSGLIAKAIPVVLVIVALFIGYNLLFGKDKDPDVVYSNPIEAMGTPKVTVTTSYYSTPEYDKNYGDTAFGSIDNGDGTAHFGIVVEFKAEESEMEGVEEYRMCIGRDTGDNVLTPGRLMSGDINLPVGKKFEVWVVSGDTKSEIYSIEIGPKGGTTYFECTVGEGGKPVLTSTSVLGKYIWVERVG